MRRVLPALLLALLLSPAADARVRNVTDADAPRAVPVAGGVTVRWSDPAGFTDLRASGNPTEARRGNWVEQLALHLRDRAQASLAAGDTLDVEITDIRRAGGYEPWRGVQFQDVRILREIYPPRIALRFQRTGAGGQVIAQGERTLVDGGYLMGASRMDSDPLRYEKRMLDRWVRQELGAPRA